MEKALLLSVLVANVALPAFFSRDPQPRRGLRRALTSVVVFDVLYLLGLLFVHPLLVD